MSTDIDEVLLALIKQAGRRRYGATGTATDNQGSIFDAPQGESPQARAAAFRYRRRSGGNARARFEPKETR